VGEARQLGDGRIRRVRHRRGGRDDPSGAVGGDFGSAHDACSTTFISVRESTLSDKEAGKGEEAGHGIVAKLWHMWKGLGRIVEGSNG